MFRNLLTSAAALAAFGLLGAAQIARADDCCDTGCGKPKCQPYTDTKTVKVHCYTDKCEDFCLPKCGIHPFKGWWPCKDYCGCKSDCCDTCKDDCDDFKCGHQCHRKFLVIKVHEHQETVRKCAPGCCDTGCCSGGAVVVPAPAAAPMAAPKPMAEPLPAPKPEDGKGAALMMDGGPSVTNTLPPR